MDSSPAIIGHARRRAEVNINDRRFLNDFQTALTGSKEARSFVAQLRRILRKTMPAERYELNAVALRATVGRIPESSHRHVDSGYLSAVHTMVGPGTVIYERQGSAVRRRQIGTGSTVVITGERREAAIGVKGPVHSAPRRRVRRRLALVVYFTPDGRCPRACRSEIMAREAFFDRVDGR